MSNLPKELVRSKAWPIVAFSYLALAGFVSLALVAVAWPGGDLADRFFGRANRHAALRAVHEQRLAVLARLNEGVNRALGSEYRQFTGDIRAFYRQKQALVDSLLGTNAAVLLQEGEVSRTRLLPLQAAIADLQAHGKPTPPAGPSGMSTGKEGLNAQLPCTAAAQPPCMAAALAQLTAPELSDYEARLEQLRQSSPAYFLTSRDLSIMVVIRAFGSLGACIQGVSSVAVFVGVMNFKRRWMLFYFSRPFVGAGVALGMHLVMKAGLTAPVKEAATQQDITLALPSAVAMLVGLFSGEALEKLRSIASALFESNEKKDTSDAPELVITSVVKKPAVASQPIKLSLFGSGFTPDLVLLIDNDKQPHTLVSTQQIDVVLPQKLTLDQGLTLLLVSPSIPPKVSNSYHLKAIPA